MREDLERLAREAGLKQFYPDGKKGQWFGWPAGLERFAQLVRAQCARQCEEVAEVAEAGANNTAGLAYAAGAKACAAAIRNGASCGTEGKET